MSKAHQTHAWRKLAKQRRTIAAQNNEPCSYCHQPINYQAKAGTRHGPTAAHPGHLALGTTELIVPIEDLTVMHGHCARKEGAKVSNLIQGRQTRQNGSTGPARPEKRQPPVLPTPPRITPQGVGSVSERHLPDTLSDNPRHPDPATDGLPRLFSPPHPEAVASRGDEMTAHAEARRGTPMRWFQWLIAQRRYEVRADGTWCWSMGWTSVARQLGKSVDLQEDAAWSGSLGVGLILHAANRVSTARDMQAKLWKWARNQGLEVAKQLGDSRITWPDSVWQTTSMGSAYSQSPARLLVEEAWDMDPVQFWDAMYPGMGDQDDPQALFWSTANKGDRGLAADLRVDGSVCRMEWGALAGEDIYDPEVWKASSPFWKPSRLRLMKGASSRPMFEENWLNIWPEPGATQQGPPLLARDLWVSATAEGAAPARDRAVIGLAFDEATGTWPVARAGREPSGRVVVELIGVYPEQGAALAAATGAAGRACELLVPSHALYGQVRVPRLPAPEYVREPDARSAAAMAAVRLESGQLVHGGDPDATRAVLTVPGRRVARRWDAGTMMLVCAWWAARDRPRAAGA